jgi:hypothetical protein
MLTPKQKKELNKKFTFDPLNKDIDLIWAGKSADTKTPFNNYYDYYFSGEDIKVYIDGLFDPEDELDIASFAYSVRQEKQPLYGFWSYNYDAVMMGTRLISGEFTIFTRYPRRMTDFLEKAAKNRATLAEDRKPNQTSISSMVSGSNSTEDELNVQKYWTSSLLDRISVDPAGTNFKNIFSAHPPFNFVILYGVEETAITPLSAKKAETYVLEDDLNRMIYSDVNQRTVKLTENVSPMKVVLQQINLMNMSTMYAPGGQPIAESYQFIARDYYFSEADLSFISTLSTSVTSDSDVSTGSTGTSTGTSYGSGGSKR